MVVYLSFALVHIFYINKGLGDHTKKVVTMIPSEKLIGNKGQILCTSIYYKCNNIKEAELITYSYWKRLLTIVSITEKSGAGHI